MTKRTKKRSAHTVFRGNEKKTRIRMVLLTLLTVAILGAGTFYVLNSRSNGKEFNTLYPEAQKEVSEGKYESAGKKLTSLRANGYAEDYRVLITSADLENYLKNADGAKLYADKVLALYKENPLLLNKDQLNRMEGYSSKILLPSPHDKKDYTVPKEQEQNADFQG